MIQRTPFGFWLLAIGTLLALALVSPAAAVDDETLAEVLEILQDEGMIDEARHAEMAATLEERRSSLAWLDRISLWGDFRARYENFLFDNVGGFDTPSDRHRFRYRVRLNVRGDVNDYATIYVRLASGEGGTGRSRNQTLGRGVDFDADEIRLDQAFVTLTPTPKGALDCIDDGYLGVDFGKVNNPFVWKSLGADNMIFDSDLNPEGAVLRFSGSAGEAKLFSHTGYFIVDENGNSPGRDPHLFGTQLGGSLDVGEGVTVGARGSYYQYSRLDDAFVTRAVAGGNLVDGFSSPGGSIKLLETSAFIGFELSENFPVLIFGTFAHNLSARHSATTGAGRNNDAYATGIRVGDKQTFLRFGMTYVSIQANALPSMFIDSDNTDGETNRAGFIWTVERQLFKNVDFVYQIFQLNRLRRAPDGAGGDVYANSLPGADRVRMRADLSFKF